MTSAQRRAAAMRRTRTSDAEIPALAKTVVRKGKAPQRVGMWGQIDMYYETPTRSSRDRKWDSTVSNQP